MGGEADGGCVPIVEVCDGVDNDCDGQIDEGFPDLGRPCQAGAGACINQGQFVCTLGGDRTVCSARPGEPGGVERCDRLDNDCDGAIDEGFDIGRPCSAGVGACQRPGRTMCDRRGDGVICDAWPGDPVAEICDGLDNDCDGVIDNGVCDPCAPDGCPVVGGLTGVTIFDPVSFEPLRVFAGLGAINALVASAEGGVVYAGTEGEVLAIDLASGQARALGAEIFRGPIDGLSIDPADGAILGSGGQMPEIRRMTPGGLRAGAIVPGDGGGDLRSTAWSPGGALYLTSHLAGPALGGPVHWWGAARRYRGTFGGGGLISPFGIAVTSAQSVIIASQENGTYYVFSPRRVFREAVVVGCGGPLANIAVDAADNLFVSCPAADAVVKFDPQHREVARLPGVSPSAVTVLQSLP